MATERNQEPEPAPEPASTPEPEKSGGIMGYIAGVPRPRLVLSGAIVIAGLFLAMALCSLPDQAQKFYPPPPVTLIAVTEVAPTGTALPTWTPVPTNTPPPLVDLPNQQRAYQEYRVFHLLYEYRVCYRHAVLPPPTPMPTPTQGPTPEYTGQSPDEPWRDDPCLLYTSPSPRDS